MDPIARAMFMGSAAAGGFDPTTPLGTSIEGGFFAGLISHTSNSVATHAIILAPRSTAVGSSYPIVDTLKNGNTNTLFGATSDFDGASNSALITDSEAVSHCTGLSTGGYTDWYLPARYEWEIVYFNLKPGTSSNNTSYGVNPYAVPARASNYTTSNPGQTSISAFQTGGSEALMEDRHWTSTEITSTTAYGMVTSSGELASNSKSSGEAVRAIRKVAL